MTSKDEEFLKKLLAIFKVQAEEHIKAITGGLVQLEQSSTEADRKGLIETMFRDWHNLKGAARSVNLTQVETLCQAAENVFSALKTQQLQPFPGMFDTLHWAADAVNELLFGSGEMDIEPILADLHTVVAGGAPQAGPRRGVAVAAQPISEEQVISPAPVHAAPPDSEIHETPPIETSEEAPFRSGAERFVSAESVRIAVNKLDPLLRQAEEMVSVKLDSRQRVTEIIQALTAVDQWKQKWADIAAPERATAKLLMRTDRGGEGDPVGRLVEFLQWNAQWIGSLDANLRGLAASAQQDTRSHGAMVDGLLGGIMNILMLPCSYLLGMVPKLVRDLARDRGKEARAVIHGGELEIDRRILDDMRDPLIHIIRNCIDHGMETPEEREAHGKPRQGKLAVSISQISGNLIELTVSDDGAGVNASLVRTTALKHGYLSEEEKKALEEQDALSLIFRSGLSTSPMVSTVSGRGLGLTIVKEKVEALGGTVSVASTPQVGTAFRIVLPVTLATFRGILVRAFGRRFVIPTAYVEHVGRIDKSLIKMVGNKETIESGDRAIPLVRLGDILELPVPKSETGDTDFLEILFLKARDTVVAFGVEEIIQEQEVLLKVLGKQLARVRNVTGASMLGTGELAPVLSVPDLIKSATKRGYEGIGPTMRARELEARVRSVLVVDDSITSRMLLKNILETSGYEVKTAIDGIEGWTAMRSEDFDLVVTDVEMPRMDGFEFTAKIRADERLSNMPVVLVTSRASREDRERGIDVGANAYVVKGEFDQTNLLEIVRRLI